MSHTSGYSAERINKEVALSLCSIYDITKSNVALQREADECASHGQSPCRPGRYGHRPVSPE